MAFFADPENGLVGMRHNLIRGQRCICIVVPLRRKLRIAGCKVVIPRQRSPIVAIGTTVAIASRRDSSHPLVPFLTAPPGLFIAVRHYLLGRQISVFFSVPLSSKPWVSGGEVIETGQELLTGAIRAASVFPDLIPDHALPAMSTGAAPPRFFPGLCCYHLRSQREVLFLIPLFQKVLTAILYAIIVKRLIHAFFTRCLEMTSAPSA